MSINRNNGEMAFFLPFPRIGLVDYRISLTIELIKDKINGLLIPVGDENALERALVSAADDSDGDRCMAHAAQEMRNIYDSEKVYGEWEKQLKRIVKIS